MKVAFLYPSLDARDGVVNWAKTVGRHCRPHEAWVAEYVAETYGADAVLLLTAGGVYARATMALDMSHLRRLKVPFGVVHNETAGALPPGPGEYPSYCWTQTAHRLLGEKGYEPTLVPQPTFAPARAVFPADPGALHAATFGHAEPKKRTLEMACWCREQGVPFTVFCNDLLLGQYESYIAQVQTKGCHVVTHRWLDRVEDLADLVAEKKVTHFLFDVIPTKRGSGGSNTSPRYAGFFGRPVAVIDDEDTLEAAGYLVRPTLGHLSRRDLELHQTPPRGGVFNTPPGYVEALGKLTIDWWGKR